MKPRPRLPRPPRLLPTPALIVAVIALVVAFSGGAMAASMIDGNLLKPDSVGPGKLAPKLRSRIYSDASAGERGAQGERGPSGERGPQGEPGAPGGRGPQGEPGQTGASPTTAFAIVRADGTVVAQRGVPIVHLETNAAGGPVYAVGFASDMTRCAIQISVVDTAEDDAYDGIPDAYGNGRFVGPNDFPASEPGVGSGMNVRIWSASGPGVSEGIERPFEISAIC